MDRHLVPVSRRAVLAIATLTPLIGVLAAAADTNAAAAGDMNRAAAQLPGHVHRTIIGVI